MTLPENRERWCREMCRETVRSRDRRRRREGPPVDSSEVVRWKDVDDRSLNRDGTSATRVKYRRTDTLEHLNRIRALENTKPVTAFNNSPSANVAKLRQKCRIFRSKYCFKRVNSIVKPETAQFKLSFVGDCEWHISTMTMTFTLIHTGNTGQKTN